jgi:hypothetical protein
MWRGRDAAPDGSTGAGTDSRTVECVACGDAVARDAAREYDKYGDRWERDGKDFEYLCKPCFRRECHQPRDGLESLLVDVGAGNGASQRAFLAAYAAAVEDRDGQIEE